MMSQDLERKVKDLIGFELDFETNLTLFDVNLVQELIQSFLDEGRASMGYAFLKAVENRLGTGVLMSLDGKRVEGRLSSRFAYTLLQGNAEVPNDGFYIYGRGYENIQIYMLLKADAYAPQAASELPESVRDPFSPNGQLRFDFFTDNWVSSGGELVVLNQAGVLLIPRDIFLVLCLSWQTKEMPSHRDLVVETLRRTGNKPSLKELYNDIPLAVVAFRKYKAMLNESEFEALIDNVIYSRQKPALPRLYTVAPSQSHAPSIQPISVAVDAREVPMQVLNVLAQRLDARFDFTGLKNLCFSIGFDHENIAANTRKRFAVELVEKANRRGLLMNLLLAAKQANGMFNYEDVLNG